jgi:hypothetical protein
MDGQDYDDDYPHFLTADSPAEARVHVHHLAVIRLGKAALVQALETGAVLHEQRNQRGGGFDDWVNTQLGISLEEAECFIRFYEESGVRTEQLSPVVEVKLPRVLELLGQLDASFPGRDVPAGQQQSIREAGTNRLDSPRRPFVLPGGHRAGPLVSAETPALTSE